jgi:hypothetical protein
MISTGIEFSQTTGGWRGLCRLKGQTETSLGWTFGLYAAARAQSGGWLALGPRAA